MLFYFPHLNIITTLEDIAKFSVKIRKARGERAFIKKINIYLTRIIFREVTPLAVISV